MRIIAGDHRGRRLKTPTGLHIRPTADRVKQYLFDVIGTQVIDACVLDLFCGTGNLGLEALSRGAQHVTFLDKNRAAIKIVYQNLDLLKLMDRATVLTKDIATFRKLLSKEHTCYHLIFADPPYQYADYNLLLESVAQLNILHHDGSFILEHHASQQFHDQYGGLRLDRRRIFGSTGISIYNYYGTDENI